MGIGKSRERRPQRGHSRLECALCIDDGCGN